MFMGHEITTTCPICAAENGADCELGHLGDLLWIRCRYCGIDYNLKAEENNEG